VFCEEEERGVQVLVYV